MTDVRLADIATIDVGYPFKSAHFTNDWTQRRLLKGDNISQGCTKWERASYYPSDESVSEKYRVCTGDVVLAMDRPWIGAGLKFAVIDGEDEGSYLVQRVARLRAGDGFNQRYLGFVVSSPDFSDYLLSVQTGSAVPHVSASQIGAFRFDAPPLARQDAIAEVLGVLDDKIATNRKLAATADELALVHFREISSRSVCLDEVRSTYDDVAVIGGGGTPRTGIPEYWDGDIPWATPTDVTALDVPSIGSTARSITEEGLANSSAKLYPAGSVLMTSRATIGAFAIAEEDVAVNQGFIVINAKDPENQWWLFHDMRSRVDEFIAHANGATFLEIPRGRFKTLPVAIPDRDVVADFSVKAAELHRVSVSAATESRSLTTLRDALLPRLMTGELRVRDAEKSVEAVW